MLLAQRDAGIHGVIFQWSGFRYSNGSLTTAYVASPQVRASTFIDALPSFLRTARSLGLNVWMGLVVSPGTLETDAAANDRPLLDAIAQQTITVAADVYARFGTDFQGWYLPIEPDNLTIRSPQTAALHGDWIGQITDELHALSNLPVMASPSMPRAIFDNKSPLTFIEEMKPVFERAGVDVWNIQDGYKMTAWTPTQEVQALRRARAIVESFGAEIWAVLYTPGPNDEGVGQVTTEIMITYLDAIGREGFQLSSYMFTSHMNPDATLKGGPARVRSYEQYTDYCKSS
jgi:hypothetical protein